MQSQPPRLFVVDDDQAVLALVGTGMTCLDILRLVRNMSPQCEAVLTTGYANLGAAVDALKEKVQGVPSTASLQGPSGGEGMDSDLPAPLSEVEREHIVRTLDQVRGNKAVAARLLGVSRRAFYRQLERHCLHQRIPAGPRGPLLHMRAETKA